MFILKDIIMFQAGNTATILCWLLIYDHSLFATELDSSLMM